MYITSHSINFQRPHILAMRHDSREINNLVLTPEIYLASSVVLETISTICLKNTLNNPKWFIPAYMGYGISFYMFPKCLAKYTLSTAYTLWCGFGIVFTLLIDRVIFREIIAQKRMFGSIIVIMGIYLSH